MNSFIHGVPMQPGFARVSVDGPIKGDSLIPVPVVGEIETVDQDVGSHVSWPRDLIIINAPSDAVSIISSYMAYLHSKVHENDNLDLFAFCDPGATFTPNSDFEAYLFNRLKEGNPDRLFFLSHNTNCHWILVLMWGGKIFVLNPLPRSTTFPDLEKTISRAVVAFNIQAGRGNKAPTVKYLSGCPKQPGGIECGYVVMRYMKEIVMDSEMSFLNKWSAKSRKSSCSRAELDEV
ncbi:hypothetical protein POM88_045917 [Heracleum sosnowskyi]|uniref:DUF8039 domain-containing protein n=1 Tax=Heracleum sosnowskyi TaxID=360622 RepID=A0AAD8M6W9_9APIA|nr:hypothetical protein POM88_045917 [Heracleum sosnowskyi]